MKWLSFIIFLLLKALPIQAEVLSINQFGGLNSDDSPLTLNNQTPDAENVVSDDGPGIKGRNGYIAFSTEVATGLWEFPLSNGNRYMIRASITDGKLKATLGDGTFTVLISTIPTDRITVGAPLGDRFYFTNTTDGLKYWTGSSVVVASAAMTADKLVTFKGRLVAVRSDSPRVLYFSKYLDGTSWTAPVNPSDDDAAQITVSGSLDEVIQTLYSTFQDKLVWFKSHSFGAIYGSRRSNFTQRTFSDVIGTATRDSVQDCADKLRWLGPDRKVWEFDGATLNKITEDIDTTMGTVAQGDSNSRLNIQTTQADWEAGTQNPSGIIDTTSVPGDLTPKTTTFSDTTSADFQNGSCVPADACDMTTTSGSLSPKIFSLNLTSQSDFGSAGSFSIPLLADTQTVPGNLQTTFPELCDSYRNGENGTKDVWFNTLFLTGTSTSITSTNGQLQVQATNSTGGNASRILLGTKYQFADFRLGTTFYVKISSLPADTSLNQILYFTLNSTRPTQTTEAIQNLNYWYVQFVSTSQNKGYLRSSEYNGVTASSANTMSSINLPFTFAFFISSNVFQYTINGSSIVKRASHAWPTGNIYANFAYVNLNDGVLGTYGYTIDDFTVNPASFTFFSAGLTSGDTGITAPIWSTFTAVSNGSGSLSYTAQTAPDNSNFDAEQSQTPGTVLSLQSQRYFRLNSTFVQNLSTAPGTVTSISDLGFGAYSTFTFTSQKFDTGFSTPTWGILSVSSTAFKAGGTRNFFTQTSSDGSSFDSRVSATLNSQVTSANKRYVRYQIENIPKSTETYTRFDSVTITAKSSGTFTTQAIDAGLSISTWGPLIVNDVPGGATLTYQFNASSITTFNSSSWTTVAKGAIPTNPANRYAAVRVVYLLHSATETATINDITISWNEGSTVRTASAFFNNRYWLSVSISSTANNVVLVYDKKKQWNRYTIPAAATVLYNSRLYFANSLGIFQAESGYSDNGSAIVAYYKTPTYAPNKLDLYSNFDYLYMTTDPSDSTLTTTYQVNGIATDYSLGSFQMNATTGLQNFKLPFTASEVQAGKYVSLKWGVSGTSFWRINNGTLYHQPMVYPE